MKRTTSLYKPIIIIVGIAGLVILGYYILSNKDFSALSAVTASSSSLAATGREANSETAEKTPDEQPIPAFDYITTDLLAPKGTIRIQHADTPEKMELGLGRRASMAPDSGMIFDFDQAGVYEFWMKDMRFPLDIVWIGSDRKVLGVTSDLSPDSYPLTVASPGSAKYVLEINADKAAQFGLATGTPLRF